MKWPNYKILAWGVTLIFIGIVTLYVYEVRILDNTIRSEELIRDSALVGLISGIVSGIYIQRKVKRKEAVETFRIWLTCLLVPVILAPLLGSLINRKMGSEQITIQAEFLEEKPYFSGNYAIKDETQLEPDGFHLFVFLDGRIERFTTKNKNFPNAKRGEWIDLEINKGAFGYPYLEKRP